MNLTILKMFGTGQITIPKEWREKFKTNEFFAVLKKDSIVIKPVPEIPEMTEAEQEAEENEGHWTTVFSADRDSKGKGIPMDELIKTLNKISREKGYGKQIRKVSKKKK